MPVASSQVVGGDLVDIPVNSLDAPDFSVDNGELGNYPSGFFFNFVGAYMGRFELEIPAGSTINSVELNFTSGGDGSLPPLTKRYALGFIADDGVWSSGGFDVSSYPTRQSVPWPFPYNVFTLAPEPDKWFGGAVPSTIDSTSSFYLGGVRFAFAEGVSARYEVAGLVSNLQAYLDGEAVGVRSNSVSGTALPVAVCVTPRAAGTGWEKIFTSNAANSAFRPTIEVDFTPLDTGGRAEATPEISPAVSARATSSSTASASISTTEVVSTLTTSTALVSAEAALISAVAARGETD